MSMLFFKHFDGCQPYALKNYIDELLAIKGTIGEFMADEMNKLPVPKDYLIEIGDGCFRTTDKKTNRSVTTYIDGMPHQCGYCVLGGFGFPTTALLREVHMNYVEQFIRDILGYTGIVLTLVDKDKIEWFKTGGYESKWTFINKRTEHEVVT